MNREYAIAFSSAYNVLPAGIYMANSFTFFKSEQKFPSQWGLPWTPI